MSRPSGCCRPGAPPPARRGSAPLRRRSAELQEAALPGPRRSPVAPRPRVAPLRSPGAAPARRHPPNFGNRLRPGSPGAQPARPAWLRRPPSDGGSNPRSWRPRPVRAPRPPGAPRGTYLISPPSARRSRAATFPPRAPRLIGWTPLRSWSPCPPTPPPASWQTRHRLRQRPRRDGPGTPGGGFSHHPGRTVKSPGPPLRSRSPGQAPRVLSPSDRCSAATTMHYARSAPAKEVVRGPRCSPRARGSCRTGRPGTVVLCPNRAAAVRR